jgi:hypothetical protein
MLPPEDLSNLATPTKLAISACQSKFIAANGGHIQQANDESVDAQTNLFAT